ELGDEFWGVDAAPAMIDQCRRRYQDTPRAHFSVADAHRLEFDDASFDAVICMGVIDRMPSWESAIAEMARVLKPGGTLIVTFPNLTSPYAWWKNFVFYPAMAVIRPLYFGLIRRPPPSALYNRVDLRGRLSLLVSFARLQTAQAVTRAFGELGLPVTDVVYYNFNLFLSPLDEWFPQASMRLSKRIEHLRSSGPRWLGAGYIVKARKPS
ncbi:MAG: class I SAM-dependent methyltransferase, partial [Chloroflexota bacterium]